MVVSNVHDGVFRFGADRCRAAQGGTMRTQPLHLVLVLPFLLAACGVGGAPGTAQVTVAFGVDAASASGSLATAQAGNTLELSGSNGVLELTTVAFIVSELELDCDDDGRTGPCADFEAPPAFVVLPLGSGTVDVTSRAIPAGIYDELEFEVEDLDVDDDDGPAKRAQIEALLAEIRDAYPGFPAEASMVVEGAFTPTDGDARPFRVFFDAEVEVEMDLEPRLIVDADGTGSRSLVVDVQPARWFERANGTVRDLSQFEGELIELEVEIEDGFIDVEFD
jgi:hypothetical protein